ncbi:MAG: hypothetical protein HZC43_01135 [Nitrosomonadales bacterium]|nr:hypothetical protein [Nitrosomonadales bacterium]
MQHTAVFVNVFHAKQWTDADLYAKYGLTVSEIAFIEKIVRPMDLASDLLEDVTVVEEDD